MIGIILIAILGLYSVGQSALADPFCDALTDEVPSEIWSYEKLDKEFSQIDKYLQENEPSSDRLVNVEKARLWLRGIQREASWSLEFGHPLEKAIIAVRELPSMVERHACGHSSYRSLLKVIIPTQCRSHTKKPEERTRLEQIIFEFAAEHAKICAPEYLERFKEEYAKIDDETKAIVAKLFTPEIEKKTLAGLTDPTEDATILNVGLDRSVLQRVPMKDILMQVESFAPFPDREMYSKELNRFTQVKFLPLPDKIGPELVEKYIIKPCRKFKGSLRGVFMPARLDMLLNADQWMTKAAEDSIKSSDQFKQAWHNFRMCELIISNDDQTLVEIFKEIAYPKGSLV